MASQHRLVLKFGKNEACTLGTLTNIMRMIAPIALFVLPTKIKVQYFLNIFLRGKVKAYKIPTQLQKNKQDNLVLNLIKENQWLGSYQELWISPYNEEESELATIYISAYHMAIDGIIGVLKPKTENHQNLKE